MKPGNILLAEDGRAMVNDYIARLAADAEAAKPGTTLGSVHYFSPEQACGATIDAGLRYLRPSGSVMYEALGGSRLHRRHHRCHRAGTHRRVTTSPHEIRPEIPVELDAVVRRALAPDPDDRYANGNAMAAALEVGSPGGR